MGETLQQLQNKILELEDENNRLLQERNAAITVLQHHLESRPWFETRTSSSSSSSYLQFSEYTFDDIKAATHNFSDGSRLGEGGYGLVYKGQIEGKTVAVKVLREDSLQGREEFVQEVDLLMDIRHPHLVRVLGACFERGCIVYEYMSNGSLADRLSCRNHTPPLLWLARIRIATEVCSALHFLRSLEPVPIVHRDLKPENILLDEIYASKISDFGLARLLPEEIFKETVLKGTFAYMDPDYLRTGESSHKYDVYSMGIIILQLLTGKPALGLVNKVERALYNGKFDELLDPSAGKWPFEQAVQLAYLALDCTQANRTDRVDLHPTVITMLHKLRIAASKSIERDENTVQPARETQVPNCFLCPICQHVMDDPHIAADGFSYELEAIKLWFQYGHRTSPSTNLRLDNTNLIPNHSLRSAIQDWQEKAQSINP